MRFYVIGKSSMNSFRWHYDFILNGYFPCVQIDIQQIILTAHRVYNLVKFVEGISLAVFINCEAGNFDLQPSSSVPCDGAFRAAVPNARSTV